MAPQLIYYYLVCGRCRDPLLLEEWRTPRTERPGDMANIAIRTLYFDFDPEETEKGSEENNGSLNPTVMFAIASLEDLCGPREKYNATTQAGKHGSKQLREKLLREFAKYVKRDTAYCPCKLCHKDQAWEYDDIPAAHDSCSLM